MFNKDSSRFRSITSSLVAFVIVVVKSSLDVVEVAGFQVGLPIVVVDMVNGIVDSPGAVAPGVVDSRGVAVVVLPSGIVAAVMVNEEANVEGSPLGMAVAVIMVAGDIVFGAVVVTMVDVIVFPVVVRPMVDGAVGVRVSSVEVVTRSFLSPWGGRFLGGCFAFSLGGRRFFFGLGVFYPLVLEESVPYEAQESTACPMLRMGRCLLAMILLTTL